MSDQYFLSLAAWFVALFFFIRRAWTGQSVGLALAYWAQLALIHLLAGCVHMLSVPNNADHRATLAAFPLTGLAMAGLIAGTWLVSDRRGKIVDAGEASEQAPSDHAVEGEGAALDRYVLRLGWTLLIFGLTAFLLPALGFASVFREIPAAGALFGNNLNIAVAGICLLWWSYYRSGREPQAWLHAGMILLIPMATVLAAGFLGYGISAMITLSTFVFVFYRNRYRATLALILLGTLGLWFAPIYFGARGQIREAVWGEKPAEERLSMTGSAIRRQVNDSPFAFDSFMASVDGRLNYNILIGLARDNFEQGRVQFAEGETLWNAVVALVPRAIWPGKPSFAGSGNLVSRFTGVHFAEGTSVGIGHVMEMYVNFGPWGLFIGFAVIGAGFAWLDRTAAHALHKNQMERFLVWFMVGQAFLMAGGVLAEAPPAAVGAVILVLFATRYLCRPGLGRTGIELARTYTQDRIVGDEL